MSKYTFDINKIKGRIKELRLSNNITQKKLAEALNRGTGTSRTTVTTWESNSNTILPDIQTIIDICNFFDCDLDYLFGKSNIKSQDHDTISNLLHISKESINALKTEFEKRNPTEEERLNIRSQSSYPYSETPKGYWAEKMKENPHYNVMR